VDHELETKISDILVEQGRLMDTFNDRYGTRLDAIEDEVLKMKAPASLRTGNSARQSR